MKCKFALVCILAVVFGLAAVAADVNGKWVTEAQGQRGPQTFTLKADGGKLTGTVEGGRGGPTEIQEGTVSGDNVSFKVVREFNGNKMTMNYKGTVSATEIKFQMTMEGGQGNGQAREVVAKKAAS